MDWMFLILAGFGEVAGVVGINRVNNSKTWAAYALLIFGFLLSFFFLSLAMKTIAMGTAYAVWTGIGTVGSTVLGMLAYGESRGWRRLVFMSMVLSAAVGLKLIS